ncbi:MAG: PKD domain-containing protein, partial [Pirellula sp.]
ITEGDSISLSANATDPANDALVFAWDLDNDGQFDDGLGSSLLVPWSQLVALGLGNGTATYPIGLQVTDDEGAGVDAVTTLQVLNRAPAISTLEDNQVVEEGSIVTLSGAFTDPSATDTHTFAWTITKNGSPYAVGTDQAMQWTPDDQGSYLATLTVTDSDGASDTEQFALTATNVAPRATIHLPTLPSEGANSVSISALLDGPADLVAGLKLNIDIGDDGVFEVVDATASSVDIQLPDQGDYVLRIRLEDKDGATRDYLRALNAINAPPSALFSLSALGVIQEGQSGLSIGFSGATDPSPGDTTAGFLYSYDLDGDGVFEIERVSGSSQPLAFPQDGVFPVRGRIHDRDGGVNEYSISVAVNNVAPQVLLSNGVTIANEGSSVLFAGAITDPGADIHSAVAVVRRTSVANDVGIRLPVIVRSDRTFEFEHVFDRDVAGGFDVVIVVSDGLASAQQSRHVSINNVVPAIDSQSNASITAGRQFVRKVAFADPGNDVWAAQVDVGQGFVTVPLDVSKKSFYVDHMFALPGMYQARTRVFDGLGTTEQNFQVEVLPNSPPTVLHPIANKFVLQGSGIVSLFTDLTQVFSDSDGPNSELVYSIFSNSNATLLTPSVANGALDLSVNSVNAGMATLTVRATDAGGLFVDESLDVIVQPPSFQVAISIPTSTGIQIGFGIAPDLSAVNLFDGVDATSDISDVTLIGANTGPVRGSLVWNAISNTAEFVKTGGPLLPDTYTLTLASRADGWRSMSGALLDGDANGIGGGNFVRSFTVLPSTARIVSVPDFARGATSTAGQNVNLAFDNGNPGLPVTISDGSDVRAIDFDVAFNAALINFSSTFFNVLPAGWSTSVNLLATGRMRITLFGNTPLGSGPQVITRLLGSIPANAPYGASDLVRIENLAVFTQAGGVTPVASLADAGLHKAIFVGDTNADGQYTAQDAGYIASVRVGNYGGFDAHAWTDPVIVADVNASNSIDGLDSAWIAAKSLSPASQPEIPNHPGGSIFVQAGIDPTIAVDANVITRRGTTVNVPVRITDSAIGLFGMDIYIDYDTNVLDLVSGLNLSGVQVAGMFASESGWTIDSYVDDAMGKIRVAMYRSSPSVSTANVIANIPFTVKPNAPFGVSLLNANGFANVPPFSFSFQSGSVNVVNQQPTDISLNQNTVLENTSTAAADLLFGQLGTVDLDPVDSYIYDLVLGAGDTDNARFNIVNNQIFIKQGQILDYETKPSYNVRVRSTDSGGLQTIKPLSLNVTDVNELVEITNRKVYYKGSDYSTLLGIDGALDNTKSVLASGAVAQTTTEANKINYSRGINGMVIDVAGLASTSLTAADFTFRVAPPGASGVVNPSAWANAPVPTNIVVTPGSGLTPARIRIEWADNAIQNTWLQVIVKANANTGLSQQSAFYMGHAMAEITGGAPYRVTAADLSAVQSGISNTIVSVGDPRDINKDRRVTAADLSAVQSRISNSVLLNNITVPVAGSTEEG